MILAFISESSLPVSNDTSKSFIKYLLSARRLFCQTIDCHFQYITTLRHYEFICNCSSVCFRLLVISKWFNSFLSVIKPLRDISFLHIMFCCQFSYIPYAKYTKNWVLFFGIVKPGKALEPRGLTTAFFLSKLFHWKRIISTRLTLYWNAFVIFDCGFFLIYVYCCWSLNIEFSSLRRRGCFYSR